MKDNTKNVIIIGGGPAGLAAAVYLSRANLSPLLFAGSPPGGQLTLTSEVENYPGFESILGPQLIDTMRKQAIKFGTNVIDENILKIDLSKKPFILSTLNKTYQSKAVLIATGAKALWLGLDSELRLRGRGVSACATCDGFFFKGKTVAVVGGGDTAMEEASTLTKFANKVYIIHRRNEFRASKIMQERVLNNPKVEVIYNSIIEEVLGENRVEGVSLKVVGNQSKNSQIANSKLISDQLQSNLTLQVDGLFLAIGHKPDTDIFNGQVEVDEKGYVITSERLAVEVMKSQILNPKLQTNHKPQIQNSKQFENLNIDYWKLIDNWKLEIGNYRSSTSVKGVFAAGDCVDHVYRQAATAAGMGVAAALDVERYLAAN